MNDAVHCTLPQSPRLVADIGGTNARFALLDAAAQPTCIRTLACADHVSLADAARAYLADCGNPQPAQAAIAIANPITGDQVRMTNHHWSFSIAELKAQLRLDRLDVVNDFTALALALPVFTADDLVQVGGSTPVAGVARALIGPGTGLGVSGLVPHGNAWVPLSGEGGHVTLAAADEAEDALIACLRRRFDHVSAERALSGPGLVALHQAVAELAGSTVVALTPAEITTRAVDGSDAFCRTAVDHFCALLGGVAGNLALTLGARGGVYIGGGIVPQLGDYFLRSCFRQRFEGKGRFVEYLAPIPCYVIRAPYPGLVGASRVFASA